MKFSMKKSPAYPLNDWIPYKLIIENEQVLFRWLYLADKQFREPFFDETILRCKSHPFNSKYFSSATAIEGLKMFAHEAEALSLTAFIFHISRCGSTLLSQLLLMDKSHIVLSEVPLIDELLRLPYKTNVLSATQTGESLRAVISLLGKKRTGRESHLFIKLDSWHLLFYKTIRKLYPQTPFILLYRSPGEVLRSHQKQRGMQAVPGMIEPQIFGWKNSEIENDNLDFYAAKVLEKYFSALIRIAEKGKQSLLLNYRQGATEMVARLADFTGITFNNTVMEEIRTRSLYHSKYPQQIFTQKDLQHSFSFSLSSLFNLYERLEEKRKLQLNHSLQF